MLASGFDYFGGGSIRQPTGADGTLPDLYEMAAAQGYHVFRDNDAALAGLNGDMGKVLITSQQRAEGDAMKLRVDAQKGDADLAAYVEGGLKVLGDQEGFFYAIEGGLIDWAAHENDLGAVVREVLDLEKAVRDLISISKKAEQASAQLEKDPESMSEKELAKLIADVEKQMRKAAAQLDFESAVELRDRLFELKKLQEQMN